MFFSFFLLPCTLRCPSIVSHSFCGSSIVISLLFFSPQHAFARSAELAPEDNPSKWMYLGQLQAGAAAVQSFQRGVDLLQRHKAQLSKSKAHRREAEAIDLQVSTALCSMAELYTTDLWYAKFVFLLQNHISETRGLSLL